MSREKKHFFTRKLVRLGPILFFITFLTALLVSAVNMVTKDKIAALKAETVRQAMTKIMPGAGTFAEREPDGSDERITAVYAAEKDGETVGYCLNARAAGFGGPMDILVGVGKDGKVQGVQIVSHSETPGLGAKAQDQLFLNQFDGKSGPFTVVKAEAAAENDIQAISGATGTSKAVKDGVEAAAAYAGRLFEGGAP